MKKVVLITGASSGIGKAAALYFAEKGWDVAAAMRNPQQRTTGLEKITNITLNHMDVTDLDSVRVAVNEVFTAYGRLDAVVNNAGYAVHGPFEASPAEEVKKQFDTNVLGLMSVCREAIPLFRKQGFGTLVNIASIGGRVGFPYYSLYNSTKFAVEGFSEVLSHELSGLGIRVRLIEPGIVFTDFYGRSMVNASKEGLTVYEKSFEKHNKQSGSFFFLGSKPVSAAKVIYKAATERGNRLRYTVGLDALMLVIMRKLLPDFILLPLLRMMTGI